MDFKGNNDGGPGGDLSNTADGRASVYSGGGTFRGSDSYVNDYDGIGGYGSGGSMTNRFKINFKCCDSLVAEMDYHPAAIVTKYKHLHKTGNY